MRKLSMLLFLALASAGVLVTIHAQSASKAGAGFVAIPGTKGGQDMFGGYEVIKGWPKDISTIPGNEKWTFGAGQSVYAESPNRVFMLFRGELPNIKRPQAKLLPEFVPSIQFTSSRMTENSSCKRSALQKLAVPTARISTVRRFWHGFPTAPCLCPMDTTERASRSSTRTASSFSIGDRKAHRRMRSGPAT